jgi:ATP-dependent Clp protease adaptor protein ClpS
MKFISPLFMHPEEHRETMIPDAERPFSTVIMINYQRSNKSSIEQRIPEVTRVSAPKTDLTVRDDAQIKPPGRYNVILLNDDYTTMDFVVDVLMRFFAKKQAEAITIMLQVHRQGMGVAGVYVKEIAELKCEMVHDFAGAHGFPLHCVIEPE